MSNDEVGKGIANAKLLKGYFSEIRYKGKILIYGSGGAGSKLFNLLQAVRPDITVLGYVDSYEAGEKDGIHVYTPDDIEKITFDCVIVASVHRGDICTTLRGIGVKHYVLDDDIRDHPNPIDLYRGDEEVEKDTNVVSSGPEDDDSLLDMMVKDCMRADELYRPTNYWDVYAKAFLPELQQIGLSGFKRRAQSVMGSFAGSDLLDMALQDCDGISYREASGFFYRNVKKAFDEAGLDMESTRLTETGSPVGLLRYETGSHNITHLQYGKIVADAA